MRNFCSYLLHLSPRITISKTNNFISGIQSCRDPECVTKRKNVEELFKLIINTLTGIYIIKTAHLLTSHFDYSLDLLQSKWTGEHRSPNKLAKIVVLALRFIASKKEYDKYFYHEYNPEKNTHIYRWRIEIPGKMFNGPVGIFWADGEIWEQYSASIWINQRGLQSIFPDGTGTHRGPGGILLYKKWTNPTTHRYLQEGSNFNHWISERNYFTYNSKHHALDILHINLLPCLQILISIPELFTAHIKNCKDIPEGFN